MPKRNSDRQAIAWLAVPAGIALVASGIFAGRASVRPAQVSTVREAESASKGTDDRRFAALEQQVLRLRAAVAAVPSAPEAPDPIEKEPTEGEPAAAPEPTDPVEAERVLNQKRNEFLDSLGDRLEAEPPDPRFRNETEPVISRLLPKSLGPDVRVSDVACGATLCRAKVTHPGSARLSADRLSDFMLQRESLGTMQVQLDVRDEGVTTLYFVRPEP